MHREIYSINDVCKPKIYILATFDKVIDPSGGYALLCPCPLLFYLDHKNFIHINETCNFFELTL